MTSPASRQFKRYIRQGDPKVLGKLYDQVAPQLLSLALHLTHRPAQAEDLVQEVFLQAIQKREKWDPNTSVEEWMTQLLSAQFESALEASDQRADFTSLDDSNAEELLGDPALAAQKSELAQTLRGALAELPDVYRTVVQLLVQDGMNSEEVGEVLERPAGTVRSQLARGLDRLRRILPAALGLGIWSTAGKRSGLQASAEETLELLKQRFFENHPIASQPLVHATTAGLWPWATAAVGVGLLALAVAHWNSSESGSPADLDSSMLAPRGIAAALETTELALREPAALADRQLAGAHTSQPQASPIRVTGRVLGKAGEAIPGASVNLYYWEPWSDEIEEHKLATVTGYGWSTLTDAEGRYTLDVPCLPPGPPALHVTIGESHTVETLSFAAGSSHLRPIRLGENPMPSIQLLPAGSIEGFILQRDGSSAFSTHVEISPGKYPHHETWESTERDGSFKITGLPEGLHTLRLSCRGLVRQSNVLVRAGSTTTITAEVFPVPPPLTVHVTGAQGQDFSGARVLFAPVTASQNVCYATGKTDAAGLIKVRVPSLDQHSIEVRADGFRPEQKSYSLVAGQETLEVRMLPIAMTRVRATDQATGLPMSRFALSVEVLKGPRWTHVGPLNYSAPNEIGVKSIPFTAGARCRIEHHGYQAAYFEFKDGLTDIVEVQLQRTEPITGRILVAGVPVVDTPVEIGIRMCSGLNNPSALELRSQVNSESCEIIWAKTDASGRFSFEPLADAGFWYCLRAHDLQNNGIEHWFQVDQGNPAGQELGDLELRTTGTLRAKVLVPEGANALRMTLLVDFSTGALAAVADSNGVFELNHIAEGEHVLRLETRSGFASLGRELTFTIEAGQTLERTFDLRPFATCLRHLRFTDQGQPLAGYKVFLSVDEPTTTASWDACQMGFTDNNGNIAGELPTKGLASVWIQSKAGEAPRRHPTASVPLTSTILPVIEVAY